MKKVAFLFMLILSFGLVSAVSVLYDDFSSGELDESKWEEIPGSDINDFFVDEHYVSYWKEVYHTAQLTPGDRAVTLLLNRTFVIGETLEYDVDYISGEGNRINTARINNEFRQHSLFGFWNSVRDGGVGNDFGLWHVKLYFEEEGVRPEITLPNGTTRGVIGTYIGTPSDSYTYGPMTRTGHNGIVHMDYDNFWINGKPVSFDIRG